MKFYEVVIEETVADVFRVEANESDEAMLIAINKYKNGTFVLEPGHVIHRQLAIAEHEKELEWQVF